VLIVAVEADDAVVVLDLLLGEGGEGQGGGGRRRM